MRSRPKASNSKPSTRNLAGESVLAVLHGIIDVAGKEISSRKALARITSLVRKAAGFSAVRIHRYNRENDTLEVIAQSGGRKPGTSRAPLVKSAVKAVVTTGRPYVRVDPRTPRGKYTSVQLQAAVAIRCEGKVAGVLSGWSHRPLDRDDGVGILLTSTATEVARILEREAYEETLRELRDRLEHIYYGIQDALFIVNPKDATILEVNDQAEVLTGRSRSGLVGANVSALWPEDEIEKHKRALNQLRRGGVLKNLRGLNVLRKDGKRVPAEVNARLVTIGRTTAIVGIVRDISEQLKAEVKLTASEELLRVIVEGTPEVFFYVHDTKGVFTYISPSIQKLTGHSVDAWKTHYRTFLTDSPINKQVHFYTERTVQGHTPPTYLSEVRHADGRPVLLEVSERPIFRNGKVIGVQGVGRDITERKRLEEAILESRDYLNRILSQIPLAVSVFDPAGVLVDVNDAFLKMFEIPEKRFVIGKFNLLANPAAIRHPLYNMVKSVFHGETIDIPTASYDAQAAKELGMTWLGRLIIHLRMFPVVDRSGRTVNVVALMEDVSDRMRLEQQLIQSQKMESIGLLAGGIAHDFNNILAGILGYSSHIKSLMSEGDRLFSYVDTIERSAVRAAELTSQLLAFARGGKYVVHPIEINSVIDETVRLLKGSIEKSIRIEVLTQENLPAVEADASQMQQVLMNLCINARDAMPNGGTLTIGSTLLGTPDDYLMLQQDLKARPYVCLSITDTGTGIDNETLGRIFEPFFTTKEKGKGTGLGLATVYGIVHNHNGYINVLSTPGEGTTFCVYLPTVDTIPVAVEAQPAEVAGGRETVMIVDDEAVIRSLARDILEAKGYTVIEASDGLEAVEIYKERGSGIDLVILDMAMPIMGGKETFEQLKRLNKGIKVILSTGYAEDDRARDLMARGVLAFVQKPYRVDEFMAAIRRVLDSGNGG
jgi:two-component system cell cycle sensor histidine kinase/response regulator CckA